MCFLIIILIFIVIIILIIIIITTTHIIHITGRPTNLQPSPSKETMPVLGGSASKQGLHGAPPAGAAGTGTGVGGDDDEFDIEALLAVTHR